MSSFAYSGNTVVDNSTTDPEIELSTRRKWQRKKKSKKMRSLEGTN
jgi:hypothetical protein